MLSDKVKKLTPSFTLGISTKVKELKSQGIDVLNLSIGEPDFFTPENAKEYGKKAINDNKTKYDVASGLLELKDEISRKLKSENSLEYSRDEIVVSSGAKHSITNTLMAITNPGDEVLIPKPYWVSYPEMVKLTGGVPIFIDTKYENSFKLTKDELLASITPKTKALFITNPSNPTGAVYTKDDLIEIVNVCIEKNILIIADEIYEKVCYLDKFTSIASLSEEAKKITITINGMSKSASMTGWRIGYTASTKELAKAMGSIQGHLVSHPSVISQYAALGALKECASDMDNMVNVYKERRDKILDMFNGIDELSVVEPNGAFYVFINIEKLKEKVKHDDSLSIEVCTRLLEDYRTALVPGIAFGLDNFVRMSYATDMDTITEGISRFKEYIDSL